jgi:hypothetical protein
LQFFRGYVSVQHIFAKSGYAVSGMAFVLRFFDVHEVVLNEYSKSIAGIATREVRVVRDIASTESKTLVEDAENRHVGSFHPLNLPMHNCMMKRKRLYMTGLYCSSHSIELHTLRYREVNISSWGLDIVTSHELGVTLRLLATKKRVDACCQQTPSSWQQPMYTNGFSRLKLAGANAAQTPSRASAPDQLGTLVGADTQPVTATNQSPHTVQEVDGSD